MCRYAETDGSTTNIQRELLPTNVVPSHYDVTLEPNLETFKFDGHVKIDLDVAEADTTSVSVHTFEIDIEHAKLSVSSADGKVAALTDPVITFDTEKQTTTFDFKETLPKGGKATLEVKFVGELNDKMAGFYRSSYAKPDGSKGIIATSQMEATDARRAFPCFDEPNLKAEFTVTLIADKHLTCLSNMDVAEEKETESGKKAVKFNKTPMMSTYLVAFIVGELNYIETNAFRVPIRVYAPPSEDIENGRYALDIAAKGLEFYEKEFGIPYPLPKLDQVAMPDFAAGAMENWGLITYRTVEVLFNASTSGAVVKERVSSVILHELAHQWFGNLVTMKFWEGLWLNEGWAEFGARYSLDHLHPEWKLKDSFVSEDLQSALSLDGLKSSHPIEVPVNKPEEINEIFDAISYSKGSCVVHMIAEYLGEDVFMEGVRRYLKQHMYGNATTEDLWKALSETSGKDVAPIMDNWVKKTGYPVVKVTNEGDDVHVEQHRFLTTGDVQPEDDEVKWPVFLKFRTKDGVVDGESILSEREGTFNVKGSKEFFKINANSSGFYRTQYSSEQLQKLGAAADQLTVRDRVGLVADACALSTSGYQKTSLALTLFKALAESGEDEFLVWDQILSRLGAIRMAWIHDETVVNALLELQREISSPLAHKLGWTFSDNDGHVEQQFKALVFSSAGMAGDEKVLAASRDMFAKFMDGDRTAIHPNIRGSVFSMNLKYGGEKEYQAVLDFSRKAETSDQRNSALRTLGQSRQMVPQTLDLLLGGKIRDQDIYLPIGGLRSSREGIEGLFNWLKNNWDVIYTKFPKESTMIGSIVAYSVGCLSTQKQLDEVHDFFGPKSKGGFDRSLAQATDSVRAKIAWTARDSDDIRHWLGIQ